MVIMYSPWRISLDEDRGAQRIGNPKAIEHRDKAGIPRRPEMGYPNGVHW